ncbi:MAG: glutathione peroxidase [Paludibacteraceae bacterium]|nr:glutathione peroxidase [Paludibacteraceae bacterium]
MKIYDFTVADTEKQPVKLTEYQGKVLLVVNTATGCGFTPQYEGLENLYKKHKDAGLVILDFPCNQFAGQAPGTEQEIVTFCQLKYKVSFPQFAKIKVNGDEAEPLYTWLKDNAPAEETKGFKAKLTSLMFKLISKTTQNKNDIRWNFTKFLVNRQGEVIKRYAPTVTPAEIEKDILKLL